MGLKIIGTGRKLPKKIVANNELSEFLDTSDDWIVSRTGIKNRTICTDETLTDLAEQAGRIAIEKSGLDFSDIDLIICSTISGDFIMPSLACCVSERFGTTCTAFDISAACTGFIYSLDIADAYINSGKATNVLIISAEMMSRYIDWKDRSTCVLFGDGAGACVVSAGDSLKYIKIKVDGNVDPLYIKSGTGNNPFMVNNTDQEFLCMQGQKVFKFAVKSVEAEVKLAMEKLGMNIGDVDYFILHQANKIIVESARTRLELPASKFPMNIDKYGNICAASVPILLDELLEDAKIKTGDVLVLIGFGAGLTTGTCVMVWE